MNEDVSNGRGVGLVFEALVEHMSAYADGRLFGSGATAGH
jgi:hypothetical protein